MRSFPPRDHDHGLLFPLVIVIGRWVQRHRWRHEWREILDAGGILRELCSIPSQLWYRRKNLNLLQWKNNNLKSFNLKSKPVVKAWLRTYTIVSQRRLIIFCQWHEQMRVKAGLLLVKAELASIFVCHGGNSSRNTDLHAHILGWNRGKFESCAF